MDLYADVCSFHHKFGLERPQAPMIPPNEVVEFRLKFLDEELTELKDAFDKHDLVKAADALVDLVYVALGTADYLGLPFNSIWEMVHEANMKKVRATSVDQSKRGSTLDVVKPSGWQSPEPSIKALIDELQFFYQEEGR